MQTVFKPNRMPETFTKNVTNCFSFYTVFWCAVVYRLETFTGSLFANVHSKRLVLHTPYKHTLRVIHWFVSSILILSNLKLNSSKLNGKLIERKAEINELCACDTWSKYRVLLTEKMPFNIVFECNFPGQGKKVEYFRATSSQKHAFIMNPPNVDGLTDLKLKIVNEIKWNKIVIHCYLILYSISDSCDSINRHTHFFTMYLFCNFPWYIDCSKFLFSFSIFFNLFISQMKIKFTDFL